MQRKLFNLYLFLIVLIATFSNKESFSQTINIPDSNFAKWLTRNYPNCMSGNNLNINCTGIINAKTVDVSNLNIEELYGIECFTSLKTLNCSENKLTYLANLSNTVETINTANNKISYLAPLPTSLRSITCEGNRLLDLPTLPDSLKELNCDNNILSNLPKLPSTLQSLSCTNNFIDDIPALPSTLTYLSCLANRIQRLPSLPNNLIRMYIAANQLDSLPELPDSLRELDCYANDLKTIPNLPINIIWLECGYNKLKNLPLLPQSLKYLDCAGNLFNRLPNLPIELKRLVCFNNQLESLPELPKTLINLRCQFNKISCFPTFPITLTDSNSWGFEIYNNPFKCLPNYVKGMNSITLAYPLCIKGDTVNNPHGCNNAEGIEGTFYMDENDNCSYDITEKVLLNFPISLRDSNKVFLSRQLSLSNGVYNFVRSKGTYTVEIDTSGLPIIVKCIYPGIDSTVKLNPSMPLTNNLNFGFSCKPGFDIGVQSIIAQGSVFPGLKHSLMISAGDMSQWLGLKCADGIAGRLEISVSGKVTYKGNVNGSLLPSFVNGSDFAYQIGDFGKINNNKDFGLVFATDTNAHSGDSICVNIRLTPTSGDNFNKNNFKKFCYLIQNSYDPNLKEVYPINVPEKYNDWLTYTIHFQNTGTAPANNIKLTDTLDSKLDRESFQVLQYSHPMSANLNDNSIIFKFPDIMLPDSHSNIEGSKGFVQYRIKPKSNLPIGTKIKNKAYIYFDYNDPVVTNTTINEYIKLTTSSFSYNSIKSKIRTYPNPCQGRVLIESAYDFDLTVTDMTGKVILQTNNVKEVSLPTGVYCFVYSFGGSRVVEKVVVF